MLCSWHPLCLPCSLAPSLGVPLEDGPAPPAAGGVSTAPLEGALLLSPAAASGPLFAFLPSRCFPPTVPHILSPPSLALPGRFTRCPLRAARICPQGLGRSPLNQSICSRARLCFLRETVALAAMGACSEPCPGAAVTLRRSPTCRRSALRCVWGMQYSSAGESCDGGFPPT